VARTNRKKPLNRLRFRKQSHAVIVSLAVAVIAEVIGVIGAIANRVKRAMRVLRAASSRNAHRVRIGTKHVNLASRRKHVSRVNPAMHNNVNHVPSVRNVNVVSANRLPIRRVLPKPSQRQLLHLKRPRKTARLKARLQAK
jgi:hypothetical protein